MVDFGLHGAWTPAPGESWLEHRRSIIERLTASFTTIWLSDHLQSGGEPSGEMWTRLTWLAAAFPNLNVGSMVLCQSLRNPGLLAAMSATLQNLSGGRLILEEEYRAFNYEYPAAGVRVEQLAETIELVRQLWRGGPQTYAGKHYRVDNAVVQPPPVAIPIMVGTNGPRALGVAARLADWWVWDGPLEISYRAPYERLREECARIGRPFEQIKLVCELTVAMPDDITDFEATYQHPNYPGQTFGLAGPRPANVVRSIRELVEVGVSHFAINVEDEATLGRLLDEVMPEFQ